MKRFLGFKICVLILVLLSTKTQFGKSEALITSCTVFTIEMESALLTSIGVSGDSLSINEKFNAANIDSFSEDEFITILNQTDVIFIDRYLPKNDTLLKILVSFINGSYASKGAIFFGFFGDSINSSNRDLTSDHVEMIQSILPVILPINYSSSTNDSTANDYKIQITQNKEISEESQIMVEDLPWTSSPAVSYRTLVVAKPEASVILTTIDGTYSMLSEWVLPTGNRVMFYSPIVCGFNRPFTLWPYFNYMNYVSALHCNSQITDDQILTFQKWPHSPIPHTPAIIGWFVMVCGIWIISFVVFRIMKKKTAEHPMYQNKNPLDSSIPNSGGN